MAVATLTKPTGTKTKAALAKIGAKKPRKTVVKRTMVEYREALLAKREAMQLAFAQRLGKLNARIAAIDVKHAAKIEAAEAKKAAEAAGLTVDQKRDEIAAEIKRLRKLSTLMAKI